MSDALDTGKMRSSIDGGTLTIQRRTYRSGDFTHVIFSAFAAVFAILFSVIAIANSTLFDGFVTPVVIGLLAVYAYFGLTRLVNSRVVVVNADRITAKDGPLPQFVRTLDAEVADVEPMSIKSSKRWTFPMTTSYQVYSVATSSGPDLFRRLWNRDEAEHALDEIQAYLTQA